MNKDQNKEEGMETPETNQNEEEDSTYYSEIPREDKSSSEGMTQEEEEGMGEG